MKLLKRIAINLFALKLFAALSGLAIAESTPRHFDAQRSTAALVSALVEARKSAAKVFEQIGPEVATAHKEASSGSDFKRYNFSVRTDIETLYRRAEIAEKGQGQVFLAKLRENLARTSGTVARAPELKFLNEIPKERLARSLTFAPISELSHLTSAPLLSPAVEKAIHVLSDHVSNRGLGRVRHIVLRNLRIAGSGNTTAARQKFDRFVSESESVKEVIVKAIKGHIPPPRVQQALKQLFAEFARSSGSLAQNPAVATVIEDLSRELTERATNYAESEPRLDSRVRQTQIVNEGVDRGLRETSVLERTAELLQPRSESGFEPEPPPKSRKLSEKHKRYVTRSMEPRGPVSGSPPRPSSSAPPVSRTYRVAIRSARAARGIAAGAEVHASVNYKPLTAYWVPNKVDGRFGRIYVTFEHCLESIFNFIKKWFGKCSGPQVVGASSLLFSDSFHAANTLLWGSFDDEVKFVDGEIVVLMSLDPKLKTPTHKNELKPVLASLRSEEKMLRREMQEAYKNKVENLMSGTGMLNFGTDKLEINDIAAYLMSEVKEEFKTRVTAVGKKFQSEVSKINQKYPRGIVIHPALHGRELSWSASRVDFWFNAIGTLSDEAALISKDSAIARKMGEELRAGKGRSQTWQFYERDAYIQLVPANSGYRLVVNVSEDNHSQADNGRYSVSLFERAMSSGGSDEDVNRLKDNEREIQRPLNWFLRNHPDFWRLNDFSTAFSLLRWMKRKKLTVNVLDSSAKDRSLLTPQWIYTNGGKLQPVVNP